MRLREAQAAIAGALLDPDRAVPDGLVSADGTPSTKRFNVYRNNVTVSLINALRDAFPATEKIVGADAFREVARRFARAHPPASPVLLEYGAGFAEFLEAFEPLGKRAWLGDVARLERARLGAYHAADAAPLGAGALGEVSAEKLGDLHFRGHPAARVVPSRFPIVTVWSMNFGLMDLGPVDFGVCENALLTRPAYTVEIRRLRPGAERFTPALLAGRSLAEAAEAGLSAASDFDLGAALGDLLAAGALASLDRVEGYETCR